MNAYREKKLRPIIPYIKTPEWEDWGRLECFCENNHVEIAYLNWMAEGNSLEIADLNIHDRKLRQMGIGSMLIEEVLKLSRANKIKKVWGRTQWNDYEVHDFYRKHGFIFEKSPKNGGIEFHQYL